MSVPSEPRSTMAATSRDFVAASIPSATPWIIASVSVFFLCGRFSVMIAMSSRSSYSTTSMGSSLMRWSALCRRESRSSTPLHSVQETLHELQVLGNPCVSDDFRQTPFLHRILISGSRRRRSLCRVPPSGSRPPKPTPTVIAAYFGYVIDYLGQPRLAARSHRVLH